MFPVLFHIGPLLIPAYGVAAALGVLAALFLAQHAARVVGVDPAQIWNLSILSLFAAIFCSRALLIALNFAALRVHPSWVLALAMVHHPLLAAFGAIAGIAVAVVYARIKRLDFRSAADALASPLALGLALEQFGALLAGSGYGSETTVRWAIVYAHPLAARWSGAPLGVPVHPVQAYASLAYLLLFLVLLFVLPHRRQRGDAAGALLAGLGITVFLTEFFRDPEGRGSLIGGALNPLQAAAVLLVLSAALLLRQRASAALAATRPNHGESHD